MIQSPHVWTPRKSIVLPDRAPYEGHRRQRKYFSFIDGPNVQHRARNLYLNGLSQAPQPDPFFGDVLYLFDGEVNGAGNALDKSSYACVYTIPLAPKLYTSVADSPVGGLSLSRRLVASGAGLSYLSGPFPFGSLFNPWTWSVECWIKVRTGAVARCNFAEPTLDGLSMFVNIDRDVAPVIYRFTGFIGAVLTPAISPPTDLLYTVPPDTYPFFDTWVFYGMYCNNGTITSTINGVQRATFTMGGAPPASRSFDAIGSPLDRDSFGAGAVDYLLRATQLRFTRNVCRQTVYPFTPPTEPFPVFGP